MRRCEKPLCIRHAKRLRRSVLTSFGLWHLDADRRTRELAQIMATKPRGPLHNRVRGPGLRKKLNLFSSLVSFDKWTHVYCLHPEWSEVETHCTARAALALDHTRNPCALVFS